MILMIIWVLMRSEDVITFVADFLGQNKRLVCALKENTLDSLITDKLSYYGFWIIGFLRWLTYILHFLFVRFEQDKDHKPAVYEAMVCVL